MIVKTSAETFEEIPTDHKAVAFFMHYKDANDTFLPNDLQEKYTLQASIFEWVIAQSRNKDIKQAFDVVKHLNEGGLPTTYEGFRKKLNRYKKLGCASLIEQRGGNNEKVSTPEQESVLMHIAGHGNNLNNQQIADYYNRIAERNDWKKISRAAVARFRKKHAQTLYYANHGSSSFHKSKAIQIKRTKPTAPLYFLTLDGWTAELFYKHSKQTKRGRITTYTNRLTLEVVLDPYCNYPLGYAIGKEEDGTLIKAALQDALRHAKTLLGVIPRAHQIQMDHFGFKGLKHIYSILANHVTPAKVGNAKAKPIEPYFKYLQTEYAQHCNNWAGFGISSKTGNGINADRANAIKKQYPTIDGVTQQLHAMMQAERQKKQAQYIQGYQALPEEDRLVMDKKLFLQFFGTKSEHSYQLHPQGIRTRIFGERMLFDSFEPAFRDYEHEQWTLLYDPQDHSHVLAVSQDQERQFILEKKHYQPIALKDQSPEDVKELFRVLNANKQTEENIKKKIIDARETSEIFILPQTKGVLGNLLITDSTGRHKPNRYREQSVDWEALEEETTHRIIGARKDKQEEDPIWGDY